MSINEVEEPTKYKKPTVGLAVLALGSVFVTLLVGILIVKTITIHACLLLSVTFVAIISKTLGYKFEDLLTFMGKTVGNSIFALWFFFAIGTLIASWMLAGTIPAVVYYGLGIVTPAFFLPAGMLLCSVMSTITGTSWGTVGTVGIALVGIGEGMGMPLPITAGMIVSGAFFGDKMSPVSDTPNLSAMAAGAELYSTITAMIQTMTPAYIICLGLYTFIGMQYGADSANLELISETRAVIAEHYNLGFPVLIPIIVLSVLSIMRYPSLPTMAIGTAIGIVVAVIFQDASLPTAIEALNSGVKLETTSSTVNTIVNRGGIQSMMYTFSIAFLALSLGGMLDKCGYLAALIEGIVSRAKTVGQLVATVMTTSIISIAGFGEVYMAVIMNGNLYRKEFDKRGLNRAMLARIISEGGIMLGPVMVWTTCGAFVYAALGISGAEFGQYAFLCFLSPLVSTIMAFLGIANVWNNPKNSKVRNFKDADLSNEPVFKD